MVNIKNLKLFSIFLIMSFLCFAQEIITPSLELLKNDYNEAEGINLQLLMFNNSDKDTIAIIGDPWIRENWDSCGLFYNLGFLEEDIYPFVMLKSTDDIGITADLTRSIEYSKLNNFVQILPRQSIHIDMKLDLTKSAIEKYNNLSAILCVPFADIRTINHNIRRNQIVHEKDYLIIDLVDPAYYYSSIQERDNNSLTIMDIFTDYISIDVRIK